MSSSSWNIHGVLMMHCDKELQPYERILIVILVSGTHCWFLSPEISISTSQPALFEFHLLSLCTLIFPKSSMWYWQYLQLSMRLKWSRTWLSPPFWLDTYRGLRFLHSCQAIWPVAKFLERPQWPKYEHRVTPTSAWLLSTWSHRLICLRPFFHWSVRLCK